MNAGELRHRITIQAAVNDRNDAGEAESYWTTVAQTQAAIRPASSREVMLNQAATSQVTHTITIRYLPGRPVNASQRVLFKDRVFQIAGVINVDERNRELRLVCYETAGDA